MSDPRLLSHEELLDALAAAEAELRALLDSAATHVPGHAAAAARRVQQWARARLADPARPDDVTPTLARFLAELHSQVYDEIARALRRKLRRD